MDDLEEWPRGKWSGELSQRGKCARGKCPRGEMPGGICPVKRPGEDEKGRSPSTSINILKYC